MDEKKYQCEYYRVTTLNGNNEAELFDLQNWINILQITNYQTNVREYLDDYVRIEDIHFDPVFRCWFMQFVRIRSKDVPLLCKMDQVSTELALEENQFIAEPMVCLYDPNLHLLMIQKNRDSVSAVGIKNYINEFLHNIDINLDRVFNRSSLNRIRNAEATKKIRIRLAELDNLNIENDNWWNTKIGKAIKAVRGVNIPYVELSLSVGHYRKREIDESESEYLLEKIVDNPEMFDKVEYTILEEGKSQLINIFSDAIKDSMTFNLPSNAVLRFDVVSQAMGEIYYGYDNERGRRDMLQSMLAIADRE
ncbi:DUF6731 family protein [Facklamia sp. 7083-14-GEN3]|uniref:DUF6731 family protein n=1 Tax=Facklamia sp. 7083-14-GEN3 TaxID=2973478 RepID=UPI00215BD0D4|nr:DUF6731 family protein [Facklamia sp. 7083-14-GEN3]MCR8969590.1 hypothetical protein [Facklamia sp. 7083-14-GEN3]